MKKPSAKNLFCTIFFLAVTLIFGVTHTAHAALTDNLVGFWNLNETSGTRADSAGTNNLTDNGSVSSVTGVVGNAASFSGSNYLSIPDNAALSMGDIDFTVAGWVYLNNKSADQIMMSQYFTTTNQRSWNIGYSFTDNRFRFGVSSDGTSGGFGSVLASNLGSPSTGTWYYIVAWHDSVANTINIQVNNGTVDSTPWSTGVLDSTGPFTIGALGNPLQYLNGKVDAVGLWKRVLTTQERTDLYNSGVGLEYPFTVSLTIPTVTTQSASAINRTTATANGTITGIGGATPTTRGFEYGLTMSYGSATNASGSFSTGAFTASLTGLTCGTLYHLRAYATNTQGTGYGSDQSFTTSTCSDTITIATPVAYQVFQRNGSNQANIVVTGTYTGSPTAIEASWNGGPYTTIVASPSGGTFSGTLTNQTGGQGTLYVRYTNDTSISASKSYVGIGDIFVVAGQSNGSGRAINSQVYSNPTFKAALFGNDDVWKELVDPTDGMVNQVDSVSLEDSSVLTTGFGSAWPLVATLYMADQNVPVAFIPTTKGGTNITQWQPNASNHGDVTTLYGSMYRRINAVGGSVKAILFWQGENDVIDGTSQSTYLTKLNSFADSAHTDFGVKTVAAQIGPYGGQSTTSINNIRSAQIEAWNVGGNILPGPSLYDVNITDTTFQVHFKTDSDIQTAANRWWAAISKDLYSGSDGRGPRLSSATYNIAKTQITLTFTDDTLPILPASGYSLNAFIVKDNGTAKTISAIDKINSNQLRITLSSAATSGTITVSLGEGNSAKGLIVPTDSSTFNLPAEIFIDQATTLYVPDTTPPVRSSGAPSGTLSAGTTSTTISLTTDEAATCKYSTTASTAYSSMTNTFSTTGGTLHSTSVSGLSNSTSYLYYVRCIDASSNANTDDYTISFSVNTPANIPPTANAGTDIVLTFPTSTTTLSGSGSDSDGSIASYLWTQQSGAAATIISPTTASTGITGLNTAGTYTFRLTVTDNQSATGSDDVNVVVSATAPDAPTGTTATAGNASAIVSFTAPVSNGGSTINGYTVTSIPSGGIDTNAGSTSLIHTITGLTNGTAYTFTVTATNAVSTSAASLPSNTVTLSAGTTITHHSSTSSGSSSLSTLSQAPRSTDTTDCRAGDNFSMTTGAQCSTSPASSSLSQSITTPTINNIPSIGIKRTSAIQNIKNLQTFLDWILGSKITPLVIDGKLGMKTTNAIKLYQNLNGLKPDGIFGKLSAAKAIGLLENRAM